jgi:uncharacterized protein YfiM (DUF2279 family)
MNTIKTLIITTVITLASFAAKAQMPHLQQDKVKHFGVGALVAGSTQMLAYELTDNRGKSMLIGFGAGCVAGVAKELYDMTGRGTPSFKDALWTGIGAGIGSLSVRFTLQTKPRTATGL